MRRVYPVYPSPIVVVDAYWVLPWVILDRPCVISVFHCDSAVSCWSKELSRAKDYYGFAPVIRRSNKLFFHARSYGAMGVSYGASLTDTGKQAQTKLLSALEPKWLCINKHKLNELSMSILKEVILPNEVGSPRH